MNTDRIKEIQEKTAYPNSVSVQQALLQVWNECQEDMADKKYTEQDMIKFAFDTYYQEDMAKKYTEEDIINIVNKSRETGLTAEYLILQLNKQDK